MLCIAHRGASGHEPENTLRAMRRAVKLGADMVELDVQNVEGEAVVIHDHRLDRTTNGRGYVEESSLAYVRSLRAGKTERLPLLREVLDTVDRRAAVNIEIKTPAATMLVGAIVNEYLGSRGWRPTDFLISSFDFRQLRLIKRLVPRVRTGALLAGVPLSFSDLRKRLGAWSVNACVEFVDREFVRNAHRAGLKVLVWTVNYPEDIARLRTWGVDGVITDFPERVGGGGSSADCGVGSAE